MRSLAPALLPIALAIAVLAGCAKKTTAPVVTGAPTRDLTVLVSDSLGTPAPNVAVTCLSSGIETDPDMIEYHDTDAQGVASFTAYAGLSRFWTEGALSPAGAPPVPVAASTSTIRAPSGADTVLVRLVLHTSSSVSGTLLMPGATHHDGTHVYAVDLPSSTVTDSAGHWTIAGLAPGHWNFVAMHAGPSLYTFTIDVPAPGSTLDAGTHTLP